MQTKANNHDMLSERIRLLYKQFPTAIGGTTMVATIMITILWLNEPSMTPLYWLAAYAVITGLRFFHYLRIRPILSEDRDINPRTLKNLCVISVFFTGIAGSLWGAVPWIFYDPDDPTLAIFLIAINLGLTTGSASSWSAYMPAYIAFILTNTAPLVVLLAVQSGFVFFVLAILLVALILASIGWAIQIQNYIMRSISLRFENIGLIKSLQLEIDRAEQASRDKTMFIAAASHDLRQPMNALRLFVSSLKSKKLPDDALDSLNSIDRSAKSLSDMLNAVLDISKFESGAAQPEKVNFPIQHILSMLVEEFKTTARDKGLKFSAVPSTCIVYSDPYMLERIIRNFLSNAYRYTDNGTILLGCRRRGKNLLIEVHDTGRGIDAKHSGKIFEEFFRSAGSGGSGHPTGLGLGLAIVDSLSRALGHTVKVASHISGGSAFSVEVPIGEGSAAEQAFEPIASTEKIDGQLLLIDDDELSRNGLLAITAQWVRSVVVYASTKEALAAINDGLIKPDAIISDYRLEQDENGVKAIGSVRSALDVSIPGALISGDTGSEISSVAEANDLPLLRKPIAPAQLRATIMYLLRK